MGGPPRLRRTPHGAARREATLRVALEAARAGVWEWNLASGELRWSGEFEALLGLPRGFLGDSFAAYLELVHPDDRDRVRVALLGAAKHCSEYDLEFRFLPPGGAQRWIRASGRAERDGRRRLPRVVGLVQDVTAQKHAEALTQRQDRRYRELFEHSNDILYTLDLQGSLTEMNREGERVTGYTRDEVMGQPIIEFVLPEYRERMQQMRARKLDGEPVTTYELGLRAKDGRVVILEVSSRLLYEEGRLIGVQGSARDITARKQAAEALRRSEERLQRIVETAAAGIQIFDRNGRSVLLNAAVERMLGISRELWNGAHLEKPPFTHLRLDGTPLPPEEHPFSIVQRTGEPAHGVELIVVRPDGRCVVVSASAAPLHDEAGRFDGLVLVLHDVTERY
ncbi:MAG TPA: PAS domain S-box protein, partial [Dehalococcoidia bacterium]